MDCAHVLAGDHFSPGLLLAFCHGERLSFDVVQRVQPSSFLTPRFHVLFFLPQGCENVFPPIFSYYKNKRMERYILDVMTILK